ncbi:hypothetical protein FA95DRAFT_1613548 [Auriscalpium vulgare]|uniref:Uncharacterized protein n=1 Tax=Auriscalpium vulgare TaxID=40419 RepID=A0ACB8R2Y9_9AGAM|nr:hypothetical protein FA95DRAFT_1613548 [Auriscalpium vulgare]
MSRPNSHAGSRASALSSSSVPGSLAYSHFNARLKAKLDGDKRLSADLRHPGAAKAIVDALAEPHAGDDGFDSPQLELTGILGSYLLQEDCVDQGASQFRYALSPERTQIVAFLLGAYERAVQGMLALEDDVPAVTWRIDPGASILSALHGAADFRLLAVAFSAFQMRMREANSIIAQRYELHQGGSYGTPARLRRVHPRRHPSPANLPAADPSPVREASRLTLAGDNPPAEERPEAQQAADTPAPQRYLPQTHQSHLAPSLRGSLSSTSLPVSTLSWSRSAQDARTPAQILCVEQQSVTPAPPLTASRGALVSSLGGTPSHLPVANHEEPMPVPRTGVGSSLDHPAHPKRMQQRRCPVPTAFSVARSPQREEGGRPASSSPAVKSPVVQRAEVVPAPQTRPYRPVTSLYNSPPLSSSPASVIPRTRIAPHARAPDQPLYMEQDGATPAPLFKAGRGALAFRSSRDTPPHHVPVPPTWARHAREPTAPQGSAGDGAWDPGGDAGSTDGGIAGQPPRPPTGRHPPRWPAGTENRSSVSSPSTLPPHVPLPPNESMHSLREPLRAERAKPATSVNTTELTPISGPFSYCPQSPQPDSRHARTDADGPSSPQQEYGVIHRSSFHQEDCVDRGAPPYRYAGAAMPQPVALPGAYVQTIRGMPMPDGKLPAAPWQIKPSTSIAPARRNVDGFRAIAAAVSEPRICSREATRTVSHRYELHSRPYIASACPEHAHQHRWRSPNGLPAVNPSQSNGTLRLPLAGDEPPTEGQPAVQPTAVVTITQRRQSHAPGLTESRSAPETPTLTQLRPAAHESATPAPLLVASRSQPACPMCRDAPPRLHAVPRGDVTTSRPHPAQSPGLSVGQSHRTSNFARAAVPCIKAVHSPQEELRVACTELMVFVRMDLTHSAVPCFFGLRLLRTDVRHAHAGDALLADRGEDDQVSPTLAHTPQLDSHPATRMVHARHSAQSQLTTESAWHPPPGGHQFPNADCEGGAEIPPFPSPTCSRFICWDSVCRHGGACIPRHNMNAITAERHANPRRLDIERNNSEAFAAYLMLIPVINNTLPSALWCDTLAAPTTAPRIAVAAHSVRPSQTRPWVPDSDEVPSSAVSHASPTYSGALGNHVRAHAHAHAHAHTNSTPTPRPRAAPAVVTTQALRRPALGHPAVSVAALLPPCHKDNMDGLGVSIPASHRRRMRQGLKRELYQHTAGADPAGCVLLPVQLQSHEGLLLRFKAIAPSFEESGPQVRLVESDSEQVHFVKRRTHKHNEARRQGDQRTAADPITQATADVHVTPISNRQVPVHLLAATSAERYLEKTVLGQPDGSFLAATPTILGVDHPLVEPVFDRSARPRISHACKFVGRPSPASQYDAALPTAEHTCTIAFFAQVQTTAEAATRVSPVVPPSTPPSSEQPADMWGPKTAEVCNLMRCPPVDMDVAWQRARNEPAVARVRYAPTYSKAHHAEGPDPSGNILQYIYSTLSAGVAGAERKLMAKYIAPSVFQEHVRLVAYQPLLPDSYAILPTVNLQPLVKHRDAPSLAKSARPTFLVPRQPATLATRDHRTERLAHGPGLGLEDGKRQLAADRTQLPVREPGNLAFTVTVSDTSPFFFAQDRFANLHALTAAWHEFSAAHPTRTMSYDRDGDDSLSSGDTDRIRLHQSSVSPFILEGSDGLHKRHEHSHVPQHSSKACPWPVYIRSLDAGDSARISRTRNEQFRPKCGTSAPRHVAVCLEVVQSVVDKRKVASAVTEGVDIRLLDDQQCIPANPRQSDNVFTALRSGRTKPHSALTTFAIAQRAITKWRFALWANSTMAFRASCSTRHDDPLPIVGRRAHTQNILIGEALTDGGVPFQRWNPLAPRDPAAYLVPLSQPPPALAQRERDQVAHHPRPEHTHGRTRNEQTVHAEISDLEAKYRHWDAMGVQRGMRIVGDSPSLERRPPSSRCGRAPRGFSGCPSRSLSPGCQDSTYRSNGLICDPHGMRANRFAHSRMPPTVACHGYDRFQLLWCLHCTCESDANSCSRSSSLLPLARRMALRLRPPPSSRPRQAITTVAHSVLRSIRNATVSQPSSALTMHAPVHRRLVTLPVVRIDGAAVFNSSMALCSYHAAEFGDRIAANPRRANGAGANWCRRSTWAAAWPATQDYARLDVWKGDTIAPPLTQWEWRSRVPPCMDQYRYPVPPLRCLPTDRGAPHMWYSVNPACLDTRVVEAPEHGASDHIKGQQSRLRPKASSIAHCAASQPSLRWLRTSGTRRLGKKALHWAG